VNAGIGVKLFPINITLPEQSERETRTDYCERACAAVLGGIKTRVASKPAARQGFLDLRSGVGTFPEANDFLGRKLLPLLQDGGALSGRIGAIILPTEATSLSIFKLLNETNISWIDAVGTRADLTEINTRLSAFDEERQARVILLPEKLLRNWDCIPVTITSALNKNSHEIYYRLYKALMEGTHKHGAGRRP
jgi:hypothetical protein